LTNFFTQLAFRLGPAEYLALTLLILLVIGLFTADSLLKLCAATCVGVFLGMVGTDVNSGVARFTFDSAALADGMDAAVALVAFVLFPRIVCVTPPRAVLSIGLQKWLGASRWGFAESLWRGGLLILACVFMPYEWIAEETLPALILLTGLFVLGVLFYRADVPGVVLVAACVYGPMIEENLRRMLLLSRGDMTVNLQRPMVIATIALMWFAVMTYYLWRRYGRDRLLRRLEH
jgi:TctA family transporter